MKAILGCCVFFVALLASLPPVSEAEETKADKVVATDAKQAELNSTLRKLEKEIAAVRGLEFKKPVVGKIIPRPKNGKPGIQGYYSTKEKSLYLYDDIRGSYRKGVLIHEMVHALQDQHFGLDKLHQAAFDSDAELAMAALIEGDATYTMIELLKKEQPRVTHMLDASLAKSRNIRNAFLYAQGARYVKALKEKGGWKRVDMAYRFKPRGTASILHPQGVKTINLGTGKARGELAVLEMLAANKETAALAEEAAAGYKGDAAVQHGKAKSWTVAFASVEDAKQYQAAAAKLRLAKNSQLKPFVDRPDTKAWHGPAGEVVAVLLQDDRVSVIYAPNDADYARVLDQLYGTSAVVVFSAKDKKHITFGQLIDRLTEYDAVCIGESHDNEMHHRVQLQVIKSLFARDERLGVGMEMFQRPYQKAIDQYFAGQSDEKKFLAASEYETRWGYDWSLYRPIVEFCRKNDVPLAALNAPKELTSQVSKVGVDKLRDEEKKQLGKIDFQVKTHRDYWYERLANMHGQKDVPADRKERSYQVMTVWDGFMADSAARFQQSRQLRRMVVLAGSGHIDRGFGIPNRLAKRTGGNVVKLHITRGKEAKQAVEDQVADYYIFLR